MQVINNILIRPRFTIYTIAIFIISIIVWSYFAQLNQVIVTQGKLKPRTDIQEIQSLEGGIIRNLFVKIGDPVEQGQSLLRLDDLAFKAALKEQLQKIDSLRGDVARYQAELAAISYLEKGEFTTHVSINKFYHDALSNTSRRSAKAAFNASIESLKLEVNTLRKRIEQANKDVQEEKNNLIVLKDNLRITQEEHNLNLPAFEKGAISGIEILKLKRAVNDTKAELSATEFDIQRKIKQQQEAGLELNGLIAKAKVETQDRLNDKLSELAQLETNNTAIQDKVKRTVIKSPVSGIVKSIFSSTSGGVIQPGETMIEIVPFDKEMLVEVKILPQDIGFLKIGLPALIKLSAYDFVIYGGITGELTHLSADTITDEEGNAYYIGYVNLSNTTTDSGYITVMKPGMQANVDIISGKKTIMQYWLKPILRAKANAMREM